MNRKKHKRGAYGRKDCVFIGAWIPADLDQALDRAVEAHDSDRSKIVRKALEEKVARTLQPA